MVKFNSAAVMVQWPELALIGTSPPTTVQQAAETTTARNAAIVHAARLALPCAPLRWGCVLLAASDVRPKGAHQRAQRGRAENPD